MKADSHSPMIALLLRRGRDQRGRGGRMLRRFGRVPRQNDALGERSREMERRAEMKVKSGKVWKWLFAFASFLLAVVYGFTIGAQGYRALISGEIGGELSQVVTPDGASILQVYNDNGMSLEEWMEYGDQLVQEVEGEGAVLLKNDGEVLPLAEGSAVTLFSRSSVDLVLGGSGGGGFRSTRITDLRTAMENAGFTVNPTIWDFYKTYDGKEGYVRKSDSNPFGVSDDQIFLAEVPVAEYTQEVRDSYAEYHDAAIVVLSRIGGEGADVPRGDFGDGTKYLALQEAEKDLLREIQASGQFDTVVALINSSNALELSWIDEAQYGVDACLWIGGVGQSGAQAVADILCGAINPSGRLVDTYAVDSFSSPAMQNSGNFAFTNIDEVKAAIPDAPWIGNYVIYQEGIYVGYRYYETRYADSVTDPSGTHATSAVGSTTGGPWNYTDEVDFSFGYGLSYGSEDGTPFTQTITGFTVGDDTVDVTVHVRNDGDTAGKSVVQIYVSAPYTPGGTEKSAVVLAGFAKTGILAPGGEEDVTISVDKYDFASYDYVEEKTYVLDAGEYYFAIGNGAHDALNNILAAQGYTTADGMDYDGDGSERAVRTWDNPSQRLFNTSIHGVEVTNQFEHADLTYYGMEVTYLTRSNWDTFPTPYEGLTATDEMIHDMDVGGNYEPGDTDISAFTQGAGDKTVNFASMVGEDGTVVPFDDPRWEKLLDNMTIEEMVDMVLLQAKNPAESINFPGVNVYGGAAGNNTLPYEGTEDYTTGFCGEIVYASTFNTELIQRVGEAMGEDWLRSNTVCGYIPSANLHRTPYSGRNFEYYSEDGFLAGEMAAAQTTGVQSRGVISMPKHFALNDQETNRIGLCTFSNEQAIREVYLKAFEKTFSEAGARGTMGAYNRIGCIWSNTDEKLINNVLRGEWGFTGIMNTDMAIGLGQMPPRAALEAGTNMYDCFSEQFPDYAMQYAPTDAKLVENLRTGCHYILYNMAHTFAVNGLSPESYVVSVTPYWESILIAVNAVLAVVALGSAVMMVYTAVKGRREQGETAAAVLPTGRGAGVYVTGAAVLLAIAGCVTYALSGVQGSALITVMMALAAVTGIVLCVKRVPFLEYLPVVLSLIGLAVFVNLAFNEVGAILSKANMEGLSPAYIASAVLILLASALFEVAAAMSRMHGRK